MSKATLWEQQTASCTHAVRGFGCWHLRTPSLNHADVIALPSQHILSVYIHLTYTEAWNRQVWSTNARARYVDPGSTKGVSVLELVGSNGSATQKEWEGDCSCYIICRTAWAQSIGVEELRITLSSDKPLEHLRCMKGECCYGVL